MFKNKYMIYKKSKKTANIVKLVMKKTQNIKNKKVNQNKIKMNQIFKEELIPKSQVANIVSMNGSN